MPTKFVCLANSFKEGGRCIAGIELDSNNYPLIVKGRPKWIRPVCNTPHGEVPNQIAQPFQILDIIEIDITGNQTVNYQSENVFFNKNTIRTIGNFNRTQLAFLCDNYSKIFENRGKAVSQEAIVNLNYSLMFVSVDKFEVTKKVYNDRQSGKPQIRLVFNYNTILYDLPVTDPVFLHKYQSNPDLLEEVKQIYLTLSLGIEWEDWYYKLVAGIIF